MDETTSKTEIVESLKVLYLILTTCLTLYLEVSSLRFPTHHIFNKDHQTNDLFLIEKTNKQKKLKQGKILQHHS